MAHSGEPPREGQDAPKSGLAVYLRSLRDGLRGRAKPERRALLLTACIALAVVGGTGLVVGYAAQKAAIPWRIKMGVIALKERLAGPPPLGAIEWSRQTTSYHVLDVARIPVGRAWSLAEVDGHIVFASRLGRVAYLTPDNRVASLGIDTPMNLAALRRSDIGRSEFFEISRFRTTDLLSVETAPHRYDLYAAHHRFDGGCFRMVVSRVRLAANATGVKVVSPDWEQVFQSRDCVRPKARGVYFSGDQSGGRIVQLDQSRIALSIGDFQFDGVNSEKTYSMDPNSDIGKIIEISPATGESRIIASGLRNPQGLLKSRSGVLWETEHGPQGGDELNLIRPGANYGWPIVTYGMRYGSRPVDWPANPEQGGHPGYERPRFAFVPSVAVSNLIEPDPREFPNWGRHLLVASLKANSLYLMRLEGDEVVFAEPIRFAGERIRDIISLRDGRIAFASDDGDIHVVSNADLAAGRPRATLLTGLDTLGTTLPEETADVSSPERWGALAFGLYCSQCHSVTGQPTVGPPLDGVIGRRVGGASGYKYSDALTGRHERWTKKRLRQFLSDVESVYPGTAMADPNIDGDDLKNIVEFLASREARPPASPKTTP